MLCVCVEVALRAQRCCWCDRVALFFCRVGKYLSHYTSGKIPKAFKIIPTLRNWEEVLYLTQPEHWSAPAMYAATRLFASNLNPKMAQRFYNLILLPRVRHDIERHKKLNYHLYQAIKKAIYKPAAFFKGLLLPLADEGCTVKEAVIMASILVKCTIPVLHSSVALLKLSQLEYSGTTALFMKTLLNKKYNLPYKVVSFTVPIAVSPLRLVSAFICSFCSVANCYLYVCFVHSSMRWLATLCSSWRMSAPCL